MRKIHSQQGQMEFLALFSEIVLSYLRLKISVFPYILLKIRFYLSCFQEGFPK